jgi:ubiquinol-cytochrome c reductase cytochrome c subunit
MTCRTSYAKAFCSSEKARVSLGAIAIAISLFIACSHLSAQSATGESAGDAQNGKQLYTAYGCYECHGSVGQGGTGPRIAPATTSLQSLLRYVRQPTGQMPPYTTKVATDHELADICAYLKSLPSPPAASSIRLLNQ